MAYVHNNAGNSSPTDHSSHQGQVRCFSSKSAASGDKYLIRVPYIFVQALPVSGSTSLLCSECATACGRVQELNRHVLSVHLPCHLHCPHSSCAWRGHRKDEFRTHLRVHPGLGPDVDPCPIYDTKMILDWIKDGTPVETAAGYALDLVSERARELGFVAEWSDLWG